jgi:hypothetical protein
MVAPRRAVPALNSTAETKGEEVTKCCAGQIVQRIGANESSLISEVSNIYPKE